MCGGWCQRYCHWFLPPAVSRVRRPGRNRIRESSIRRGWRGGHSNDACRRQLVDLCGRIPVFAPAPPACARRAAAPGASPRSAWRRSGSGSRAPASGLLADATRSTTIPRASVCGCASASPIECTGPTGTPAASNAAIQAALRPRRRARRSSTPTSASRFCIRAELVAKRGSSRHSGWPSTSAIRSQLAWFAPPMLIQPSAVRNAWYGAVSRCAEPVGPGDTPVAKKLAACQYVCWSAASISDVSTTWPRPVRQLVRVRRDDADDRENPGVDVRDRVARLDGAARPARR